MENEALKKIIYVDDVSFGLTSVKNRLKDRYEIYLAQSVADLFNTLKQVKPDVILLDVKMPDLDGYDAIIMLKRDERYANIPVIFVTAEFDKSSMEKGINLGAAGYVTKPFSTEQIIEAIEMAYGTGVQNSGSGEQDSVKPCILAVDDVSSMLRTIHNVLRDTYKVYTLSEPEKLGELLHNIEPDLFLLDYKMPQINGFELIPMIREFPQHRETPIIFLTSEGTADNLTAAIRLGACDYIVKPFEPDILREKIAMHLKQN
ncbi:MAG: response regulator [Treponema sp.]|nr:response regulator [Treponema sp.]MCL2273192.1 response regulator [Treponema sp.]